MLQLIHYPEVTLYEVDVPSEGRGMVPAIGGWYDVGDELEQWLNANAGERTFDYIVMRHNPQFGWCCNVGTQRSFFQFRDKQVAMMFKLTWGGA
jgi:hypothetical protein